ncbi:MAG: glycosyltransferase [Elusimicrobia bacterium]|nr:glycosyltransferase [Elusimicrobiota bacterium]
MKVSILIPVYNERYLIGECLRRVVAAPLPAGVEREIIVVDDGSTDGSARIIGEAAAAHAGLITVIRHEKNSGKGAAIKTAIAAAGGDVVLIQDGDLEYDPADYPALLEPILSGEADAVFGSRFSGDRRRVLNFWHTQGNRALTVLSNMFTGLDLTDMWTCYKAIRTPFVKNVPLRCKGFCVEPELISKLAKKRCRIYEVPISYHGRDYDEGKKIGVRDAVRSFGVILLFWLYDDLYGDDSLGRKMLRQYDKSTLLNDWVADAVRGSLGDSVLELGGGIGNLTAKLCRRDTYFVTDDDPICRLHLERRFSGRPVVKCLQFDITGPAAARTLPSRVDTVLALNVLERIEDELSALKNMRALLPAGGRLVLLVPHLPWAYGTVDELAGHRRRYDRPGLTALLTEAGFAVEEIRDFNRGSLPLWVLNGLVLKRKGIGRVQLKLFDSFVWLFRRIDRFLPWPGQSLLVTARAA